MELQRITAFPGPGALWSLTPDASGTPVLITHGTFSNAQTCTPLAQFFARAGHPVYVITWRDRTGRPGAFDFDDLAHGEITAALAALPEPAHLIAHSGGGLAMCLALRSPENRAKTRSLTLMATQATHLRCAPRRDLAFMEAMGILCRPLGYWPARVFGLGPCNESAALLSHWLRINRAGRFTARDGADVFAEMPGWHMPLLMLAGAADRMIAPQEGCRALAAAFGPTGHFHLCAQETDGEDFTHSRLLRSRTAAQHVWPRIQRFWTDSEAGT